MRFFSIFAILVCSLSAQLESQEIGNEEIKRRIDLYKTDSRGPYKEIRWYCKDGTILPPQERCPAPGGVQRARYKDEVEKLAVSNHVFLGQILSTTPHADFWDAENHYSRLKQYQLEKFLRAADNGWVLRKAQFYRGAFQAEDEAIWGQEFFHEILSDDQNIENNFFLIRESLKDVPHLGDNSLTQEVRAVSKEISEMYPAFLDLRVKIHGQPDESDLKKVKLFREANLQKMDQDLLEKMDRLISDMSRQYQDVDVSDLSKYTLKFPVDLHLRKKMVAGLSEYRELTSPVEKIESLSRLLFLLREEVLTVPSPDGRLAVLDLSLKLEELLMRDLSASSEWGMEEVFKSIYSLGMGSAGCGYIELWEWDQLSRMIEIPEGRSAPLENLLGLFENGGRMTEWSIGMFRAHYMEVIDQFGGFEPLANGFLDDKVRSSLLLYCGLSMERLGDFIATYTSTSNRIMDIPGQHGVRGLNPGYAAGELVVVNASATDLVVDRTKIYIFNKPPSDLKPVAGIATVSEGNMVSHVQLLARNLGIPNSIVTPQNLEDLKKYSGQKVFYAVSPGGTVILKPYSQITLEEKNLIETRTRKLDMITVPVDRIDLGQKQVVSLREVSAISSGIVCGPKAANLGQLKLMFPDNVVEGIVIPFGVFRMHLDQTMSGKDISYWQYLNRLFEEADQKRLSGEGTEAVESFLLKELETFRKSILEIPLQEQFLDDLETSFISAFGNEMGKQAVFLRSDTNMEDLKDFTGAGLNLTLFNVVTYESIVQGIRKVWASPYTERSYKWRQQYLLNPENVFPSILIIPTVDVDYSGVMVTVGVSNREEKDLTIAFNLGAGGAVDGQEAESYLLTHEGGQILLSPAREPFYNRLPASGGSSRQMASFEKPVLNEENIRSLRKLATQVRKQLPEAPGIDTRGPFDMELGFKEDKIWLFQVRPFVENKNAAASIYLNSLNPDYNSRKLIPINENP